MKAKYPMSPTPHLDLCGGDQREFDRIVNEGWGDATGKKSEGDNGSRDEKRIGSREWFVN